MRDAPYPELLEQIAVLEEKLKVATETMLHVARELNSIKASDEFSKVYWARDTLEVNVKVITGCEIEGHE